MTVVSLSLSEMGQGIKAGEWRTLENIKRKRNDNYGADSSVNGWQISIEGALAEQAMHKYLGIYFAGKGVLREPDIRYKGQEMEVRSSPNPESPLILHPKDRDDAIFWLLTGHNGEYTIRGWMYGRDGKKDEFWTLGKEKKRPCFMVPQRLLRNPEEFER